MDRYFAAILTCAACLLASCLTGQARAQGVLRELREEVRQPDEPKRKRKHCGHEYACDCVGNSSILGDVFGQILSGAVSAMWNQEDGSKRQRRASPRGYFPSYPYQGEAVGYQMIDPWVPEVPKLWALRTRLEYAADFDDLSRIGGHFLYETTSRFGLDTELNYRRETLGMGLSDSLWTGDTNLLFRFWQTPHVQHRIGLGVNWLADDVGSEHGLNLTYSGDWYPRHPWVVSSELDYGRLGSATLFHGRITTGVQWDRVELYIGYDHYDVGGVRIEGLVSGLRLSF